MMADGSSPRRPPHRGTDTCQAGRLTYKNHLDGYDQTDLLLGKGPSKWQELFYFGGPKLGALRVDDFKYQFYQQPYGWPGEKVTTDMPTIVNIRQDLV